MPYEYPFESFSWTLLSSEIAIKELDKTTFLHNSTGIPKEIRNFFNIEDLQNGHSKPTLLTYKGSEVEAQFKMDYTRGTERSTLSWKSDFGKILRSLFPELYTLYKQDKEPDFPSPEMRLMISENNRLIVDFLDVKEFTKDITIDDDIQRPEGAIRYFYSKKYERVPENRRRAIEYHGSVCKVCGFDFEKHYGERGKGFIEIHHIKPLYSLNDEVIINPLTDLFPVCSNCHRMIHRQRDHVLSIEELRRMIKNI